MYLSLTADSPYMYRGSAGVDTVVLAPMCPGPRHPLLRSVASAAAPSRSCGQAAV